MAALPDKNFVHEDEIWRQRVRYEDEAAKQFQPNWGFLTGAKMGEKPRGFSTALAKYHYSTAAGSKWTVKEIRVPDKTTTGMEAAISEVEARQRNMSLTYDTMPVGPMQPGTKFGQKIIVHDDRVGIPDKKGAFLLRSHLSQTLGDALRTTGVDPNLKYKFPLTNSHDYGWRVTRGEPLEKFGVSQNGMQEIARRFN